MVGKIILVLVIIISSLFMAVIGYCFGLDSAMWQRSVQERQTWQWKYENCYIGTIAGSDFFIDGEKVWMEEITLGD